MKRWSYLALVTVIILSLCIAAPVGAKDKFKGGTLVKTKYGKVQGYLDSDLNALIWKGIPYAKPPINELRWRAPQAPESWPETMDATESCSECTQLYTTDNWIRLDYAVGSEDCLYLDIYRPATKNKNLPVYVWIHGGSNNFGTAKDYNGAILANTANLVVVVIQYRLGPLGWFTHPALRDGDPLDDSGNFGTLDTIQALRWIEKNIKAFGGNPRKVTVAGESAGSHNVTNLVISPLAKGLFSGAISQSGGMITNTVAAGEALANSTIEKYLIEDGKTLEVWETWTLEEQENYLRLMDNELLLEVLFGSIGTYGAYQDGYVVPGSVVSTIRSGNYNKVPIILGANEYETKAFMPLYGPAIKYVGLFGGGPWPDVPSSDDTWFDLIGVLDGTISSLDDVLPIQDDKDLYEITGYYGSLNWRAKFVDERARALREQQRNVYGYLFKWGGDSEIGSGPYPFDFIYGAGHSMEIPFFFGSDTSMWGYSFSPGNDTAGRQALSMAMMKYVGKFARSGNPNGSGLPVWKKWSNKEGKAKVIIFDADYDEPIIEMSNEEVTFDDVNSGLAAAVYGLPNEVKDLPYYFLWSSPE